MVITAVTEDTASCHRTYGLIQDYTVGNACRFLWMGNGYRQEWKWMLPRTGIWWAHRIVVIWNIFVQGYNRAQTYRPKGGKGLRSASVSAEQTSPGRRAPRQGARVLLMDGTAVESAFALLLTKVTKPPYPAKISFYAIAGKYTNLCAISGTDFRKRGEEDDDETNNQRYDRDRFSGS